MTAFSLPRADDASAVAIEIFANSIFLRHDIYFCDGCEPTPWPHILIVYWLTSRHLPAAIRDSFQIELSARRLFVPAGRYLFTSEAVSGGHPDKLADQI